MKKCKRSSEGSKGNGAAEFVYRPPKFDGPEATNATVGVKFATAVRFLDDWYIFGGTKWSRTVFRLKHPIVYSKRGLRNVYRRIKEFFFGEPPMILARVWKNKEELIHLYPKEKVNGTNQTKKQAVQKSKGTR